MLKRLILIISLFLLFPLTVRAEEKGLVIEKVEVIVIADELNIRSTPNTNLSPIDSVPFGTTLYAVDGCMEENWIAIYYDDQVRFVNDKYIILK